MNIWFSCSAPFTSTSHVCLVTAAAAGSMLMDAKLLAENSSHSSIRVLSDLQATRIDWTTVDYRSISLLLTLI